MTTNHFDDEPRLCGAFTAILVAAGAGLVMWAGVAALAWWAIHSIQGDGWW